MSDTWVIVKWPEQVFGLSESGFDSNSPRKGIVVWDSDKKRESVSLSSGLRKCLPYSFEHFRFQQWEGFTKALLNDLDYLLTYWLASREFSNSSNFEKPGKADKHAAKYSSVKDFHSVLEGLGIQSDYFPDSKLILRKLEALREAKILALDERVAGAYRYVGIQKLEDMWGNNPKFTSNNYASEYLRASLSLLFEGTDAHLDKRDFNQVIQAVNDSSCPVILKYAAEIWCEYKSEGTVSDFIDNEPLLFIRDFGYLVSEIGLKAPKNDSFKREIASNLIGPLVIDIVRRPLCSAFSVQQVESLDLELNNLKMDKFSSEQRKHVSLVTEVQAQKIIESLIPESDTKFSLSEESAQRPAEAVETLTAISAIHRNTGHAPVLTNFTSTQIIDLYGEFEAKESEVLASGGSVVALRRSFEFALKEIIIRATETNADEALVEKIRTSFEPIGCIPGTFAKEVFITLTRRYPEEGLRPGWWAPLSLSQIVSICRDYPHLAGDVASLWAKSDLFANELARHIRDARNTNDIAVLLEADYLFDIISTSDISRAWARVASQSAFLEVVTGEIADSRLTELRESMNREQDKIVAQSRDKEQDLKTQIAQLTENLSAMDAAMKRGMDTLGTAKSSHELGISKKYCEAMAKMIRRMEREFGVNAFKEIIAKESASLSRLGITLIAAGQIEQFNPTNHDPAGQTIDLASPVTIVETGVLLSVGKDTITILKAVVNPAS